MCCCDALPAAGPGANGSKNAAPDAAGLDAAAGTPGAEVGTAGAGPRLANGSKLTFVAGGGGWGVAIGSNTTEGAGAGAGASAGAGTGAGTGSGIDTGTGAGAGAGTGVGMGG